MHKIAEEGIAAHLEVQGEKGLQSERGQDVRLAETDYRVQKELRDSKEFLEIFKIDLFPDEILRVHAQGRR